MPNISSIGIEQYRGFYEKREIAFAKPDGSLGSGLTILVGPNNSGKSSVLNAIRLVLVPRQVDLEHRHANSLLRISITNDEGHRKGVSNPDLGAILVADGDASAGPSINDFRLVPSRRSWSPYTGQPSMETGQYWLNALNRQSQDGEDAYLVSRVAFLSPDQRADFDALLKELLPQLNEWKVELSRGQTFIQYETKSGATHAADLFGDGMASLFRIALALFDSSEGQIVAIDEPELSLHPQAQKTLAGIVSRFSADRQFIITTHSPHFINWRDISNGARVYRLTQEEKGIFVGLLREETLDALQGLMNDWQKPNLLDEVSREVFFADGVVFFEGQEDVGLVRKFLVERDMPLLSAFGYGAGGFGNIRHFLRMAKDLGIPSAAIYDGDHVDEKRLAVEEFPEAFVEAIPTPDIRDKPKRNENGKELKEIEKEGLFDRQGNIKPHYEPYLRDLTKRISRSIAK